MSEGGRIGSVLGLCCTVSALCLATCAFLGSGGCAQSAGGWQAQNQASLAGDQASGTNTKSDCASKCKDGAAEGKCCKEGKEGSGGKCCKGGKGGGDKEAAADSGKKCCKSGADATAQAGGSSAKQ